MITSFVPLELYIQEPSQSKKIIVWKNYRPSSSLCCIPVRIQFLKETTEVLLLEKERQIKTSVPTTIQHDKLSVCISHQMLLTMKDGKVCNALTQTSSAQECYVCGALPSTMNNIEYAIRREIDPSAFEFGLSPLHASNRFFNVSCIFHFD